MAKARVVTSFSPEGYDTYGKEFLSSYEKHCHLPLTVIVEEKQRPIEAPDGTDILILKKDPLHVAAMSANGFYIGTRKNKKAYLKWGCKVLALAKAERHYEKLRWLIWIDADVVFKGAMDNEWFAKTNILDSHVHIATLLRDKNRRPPTWPETGFVAYHLKKDGTRQFIKDLAELYTSGRVFNFPDWQDAYVFGHQLKKSDLQVKDLSRGHASHPWRASVLQQVMDHYKGVRRKASHYGFKDLEHPSKIGD